MIRRCTILVLLAAFLSTGCDDSSEPGDTTPADVADAQQFVFDTLPQQDTPAPLDLPHGRTYKKDLHKDDQ